MIVIIIIIIDEIFNDYKIITYKVDAARFCDQEIVVDTSNKQKAI